MFAASGQKVRVRGDAGVMLWWVRSNGSSLFSVEPQSFDTKSPNSGALVSLAPPAATGASTAGRMGGEPGRGA